ncbi:MAG: hypothetical protein M5U28_41410 [Sandaracinaceae bacterium]|nr:hypothetical protein [Sandaracinaceae bacterium]
MDALSKRLWIAVGAVGALTIVIACVGAGAVLWLSRDDGERVRETPPPAPAAPPAPVPAADPIVVAVRGLGLT